MWYNDTILLTVNDLELHFKCLKAFRIQYLVKEYTIDWDHVTYRLAYVVYKRLQVTREIGPTTNTNSPEVLFKMISFDIQLGLLERKLHIAQMHRAVCQ